MNPSMTTRHKVEIMPIEANLAAPAVSVETKLNAFPFMKLAVGQSSSLTHYEHMVSANGCFMFAEIRLEIYSYLLVASPSRAKSKEKVSRGVVLTIGMTLHEDQIIPYASKLDRSGVDSFTTDLTPQILRTCKAIHREAAAILYGKNVFQFRFRKFQLQGSYSGWDRFNLEALWGDFYRHPGQPWDDDVYDVLKYSEFAIFLLRIGQQNTTNLKKLRFDIDDTWVSAFAQNSGRAIQTATPLFKYHLPGLRQLKIRRGPLIDSDIGGWDEFEDGPFTPTYANLEDGGKGSSHESGVDFGPSRVFRSAPPPTLRQEQEKAIYKAAVDMVQEITWLKHLSFAGFDEEDSTYQKMKELQALVKARR